jgi:hypothetical protein
MHRLPLFPLSQGVNLGTHFCWRLSQPQGHSVARIMSMKNSSDTIVCRTRNLLACSTEPQPTALPRIPLVIRQTRIYRRSTDGDEYRQKKQGQEFVNWNLRWWPRLLGNGRFIITHHNGCTWFVYSTTGSRDSCADSARNQVNLLQQAIPIHFTDSVTVQQGLTLWRGYVLKYLVVNRIVKHELFKWFKPR